MTQEVWAMIVLPLCGGAGAWVKHVNGRLAAHDIIIAKMDQLITLMLEDRIGRTTFKSPKKN